MMLAKDSLQTSSFEANAASVSSYSAFENESEVVFTTVIGKKAFEVSPAERPCGRVKVIYLRQFIACRN